MSTGGPDRDRTDDLFHAMEARSQLRHRPTSSRGCNIPILASPPAFVNVQPDQLVTTRELLLSPDAREGKPAVVNCGREHFSPLPVSKRLGRNIQQTSGSHARPL